jgi:hypothetical protein
MYQSDMVATMVRHVERKALQIHNLLSMAQEISSTAHTQLSLSMAASTPCVENGRHTFMIFRTHIYVPFPQLFAKGKSLKSEGIGMHRDMAIAQLGRNWAMPNQNWGIPSVLCVVSRESIFRLPDTHSEMFQLWHAKSESEEYGFRPEYVAVMQLISELNPQIYSYPPGFHAYTNCFSSRIL